MAGLKQMLDPARMGAEAEKLERDLCARIVGQDQAVRQIVRLYQTFLAGMSPLGRPVGSLLFLGPTGTGKTLTVEAIAESLVGDPRAVVKIDCGEFQHSHEVAKLIGSPPGYLGHRETHPLLSQEAINQFQTETVKLSFVLFDEIEKASDAVWNLLLGILDKATLTLGDNRRVDFSRAMIFLTSNLGAAEMEALIRPKLGFSIDQPDSKIEDKLAHAGTEAARRRFTPEFMNRIDSVVTFRPLGEPELQRILDIELDAIRARLSNAAGEVTFAIDAAGRELLLREGTDQRYGARHLKRAIERRLVQPLSNLVATAQIEAGDRVVIEREGDRLIFGKQTAELVSAAA